jgi:hypothetical protein
MRHNYLYMRAPLARLTPSRSCATSQLQAGQEFFEIQQILKTEWRSPRSAEDKRISRKNTGPLGRQRDQPAVVVVEIDALFAPVEAISQQRELTAKERMKRMGNPKGLARRIQIRCI